MKPQFFLFLRTTKSIYDSRGGGGGALTFEKKKEDIVGTQNTNNNALAADVVLRFDEMVVLFWVMVRGGVVFYNARALGTSIIVYAKYAKSLFFFA